MTLSVQPVETDADLDAFIGLPERLYRGMPGYAAPLDMETRSFLDPKKAPFFKHGKAQYWLARWNGEPVGRISAQIDHAQPQAAFGNAGLFGCLDAIDDPEVIGALLDQAEAWLREEGKACAVGPCTLSMNEMPGLLLEGQEEPAMIMAAWHPVYLASHLAARGYMQSRELHFWRSKTSIEFYGSQDNRKTRLRLPAGVTLRPLDLRNIAGELETMRALYNDAWCDNWGFVPIEREDLEGIAKDMKPFLKKEYGIIAEKDGQPVAVAMILPNLMEITADLGAKPSLLGWVKLGFRTVFHRFSTGRIILLGVASHLRHSVGGAAIAMRVVEEIANRFTDYPGQSNWLEAGWVLDNNAALGKILEHNAFHIVRKYGMFEKAL